MIHLAAIASTITCIEAQALIDKIYEFKVEDSTRAEMILVVIEESHECWDAKDD